LLSHTERTRALRALDANRNRALEALRVVEDYARFVLEAPPLAKRAKAQRHALVQALAGLLSGQALAARDVAADPGRPGAPQAPPEAIREPRLAAVVGANLSRAKEALRSLEEFAKPLDPTAAEAVSRIRYVTYELEAALIPGRPDLSSRRVYAILGQAEGRPGLREQATALIEGGVRLLQLRLKQLPDGQLLREAEDLASLCLERDACLIVNDRPDLARLAGASGVHVGQHDLPPLAARRVVGPGALVGASVHDARELELVLTRAGAAPSWASGELDYVGLGTLFASPTKPQLGARGLDVLRELAPRCPVPIYGIGGVTVGNAAQVIEAGAHGVAVSSALLDASDLIAASRELVAVVDQAVAARRAEETDA
jgi:thiamine-phosphate pyrophosphorylase